MLSGRLFALSLVVGILALAALAGDALAAGQYVIVAAEPASDAFPPGKVLDVDDRIDVPEGTVVTLLGEDGSVEAVAGPMSITVTADAAAGDAGGQAEKRSTLSKIAGLLAGDRAREEALGVSRVIEEAEPGGLDDPWTVSVHASGAACVRDGKIVLARRSAKEAVSLTVKAKEGASISGLAWPSGAATLALPSDIPFASGAIAVKAGDDVAEVALHPLPKEVDAKNPVDLMGWMLARGCERQALALARALARDAR